MYNNKFVATIKSGGKVLREVSDTVYLPFGCEYSILLKNLNTVRAEARITIDGEDVLGGNSIVISPNSDLELERFLKDLSKGNRFKFIERSAAVEQHRGVGSGDGLIRIEWQFEKPRPIVNYDNHNPWIAASGGMPREFNVNGALRGVDFSKGESTKAYASAAIDNTLSSMNISTTVYHAGAATMDWMDMTQTVSAQSVNDVGITVPGSVSDQRFTTVAAFPLEDQKHVIVLQLKGETEYNKVTQPLTVKAKPKCVTCGKVNKATSKYCAECGTSLEIV